MTRIRVCPECGGEKDHRAEWCSTCRFNPERRFWRNVSKQESCWLWMGWKTVNGYGRFRVTGGRVLAHRYAYELLVGPIPEGLEIDHLCRTPGCVNPSHLEAVTHRENTLRGSGPSAVHSVKTHCPAGHVYDDVNTIHRYGRRYCRTCKNTHERNRKRALRACSIRLGLR